MSPKPCPIPKCIGAMPSWTLMCKGHWALVPRPLQEAVNHYHRRAKGGPSHRKACRQAIEAVLHAIARREAAREGTTPRMPYTD